MEASFEVINELGSGFLESVYEKALIVALAQKGLSVKSQVRLNVKFRGVIVGEFCADLLVNESVIVEIKAVKGIRNWSIIDCTSKAIFNRMNRMDRIYLDGNSASQIPFPAILTILFIL